MDLTATDPERMIQDLSRQFATEHVAPRAVEIDEKDEFFPDLIRTAGELGLISMELPESEGGAGASGLASVLSTIEIARASSAVANVIAAIRIQLLVLHRFGTEKQKARWLEAIGSGRQIGALAITEPDAGSDVAGIKTTAVRKGDRWLINGQKTFISEALVADMLIVLASTDPSKGSRGQSYFIVEKGTPGLSIGPKQRMMGQRGVPVSPVYFEDCEVSGEGLVGRENEGFRIAMGALDGARLDAAALSLGLSQAAYEQAAAYAATRQQFGQPIGSFQGVGFMLAEMATEIDAGRLLLYRAARMMDAGEPFSKEASMAKYFCSDNAMRHTTNAVQIFGGYGYSREYPLERYMRDVKVCQIYDGTSQIHKMIIARKILKEYRDRS